MGETHRLLVELQQENAQLKDLCDKLKLQAQIHAQEARGANATIAEIYQVVSGGTGEAGNWHGAEPVRRVIAQLKADLDEQVEENRGLRADVHTMQDEYRRQRQEIERLKVDLDGAGAMIAECNTELLKRAEELTQATQREARLRDTKEMDAAIQCLYLACEKSVADSVFECWIRYKRALKEPT